MSLRIDYQKANGAQEAYELVKKNLTADVIAKFNVKADLVYDDKKREMQAKGKGFTLLMTFAEKEMDVDLDVSFFLVAMKGIVLSKVEKMLRGLL